MNIVAVLTGHYAGTTPRPPITPGTAMTYDQQVDSMPANYHWPLRESSGTSFAERISGSLNGTGSGAIEHVAGTLVQDDDLNPRCIGMGGGAGTSAITIPSDPNLNAAAGAWFCVVQVDSLDRMRLLNRYVSTVQAGLWYFETDSGGVLRASRRDSGTTPRTVVSASAQLTIGVPQLVGFSWGNNGLRIWNGATVVAGQAPPITTSWGGAPTTLVRIGHYTDGIDSFDGLIQHIVFLAFEPTAADVAKLAAMGPGLSRLTGADLGTVQDGGQVVFNIRDHGHFTASIASINETTSETNINVTTNGDEVTVTGLNAVTNESFGLSVTDARGTTSAANFIIDVTAAGGGDWDVEVEDYPGWTNSSDPATVVAAFAWAINQATGIGTASVRGVIGLVPGRTYIVRSPANGTNSNPYGAIIMKDNVEIITQNRPLVGSGNQAIIMFESWAGKSGVCQRCIIRNDPEGNGGASAHNTRLGWLILDGNYLSCGTSYNSRRSWLMTTAQGGIGGVDYSKGGNGGFVNTRFSDSNGCSMVHVESRNALTDAISLRNCNDFLVEDCDFHHLRRNGITVVNYDATGQGWDNIVFRRTAFREIGEQSTIPGEAPATGFDLEPLQDNIIEGLTIDDCDISTSHGNTLALGVSRSIFGGRGLSTESGAVMHKWRVINSRFENNRSCPFILISNNTDILVVLNHVLWQNNVFRDNGAAAGGPANAIQFNPRDGATNAVTYINVVADNNQFIIGGSPGGGYSFKDNVVKLTGHDIKLYRGVGNYVYSYTNPDNVQTVTTSTGAYTGGDP